MAAVNPIRGEVEAKIGSLSLVMVVTIDGLAKLSAATSCQTLQEVYRRLYGTEPSMVLAAIRQFTESGEVDGKKLGPEEAVSQALARMTVDDFNELQGPLAKLLAAVMRPELKTESPQGNGEGAQNS